MSESYVTVVTNDISCLGCLVLCNSLKQTGTEKKISALVYPNISQHLRNVLQKSFDYIFYTEDLSSPNSTDDSLNIFDDGNKLKCWLLTQFTKCVFLESDVLVVENIDDLFERSELSAVSDTRWPDCFDTGVFVFEPSHQTYVSLIDFAINNAIGDKSIQSLLNLFFANWNTINIEHKIPFIYNCQLNSTFYTHTNALVYFGRSIKAARLGNSVLQMMQPTMHYDSNYDNWNRLWAKWWKIFNEMVKPAITAHEMEDYNRINWAAKHFSNTNYSTEFIVESDIKDSRSYVGNHFERERSQERHIPRHIPESHPIGNSHTEYQMVSSISIPISLIEGPQIPQPTPVAHPVNIDNTEYQMASPIVVPIPSEEYHTTQPIHVPQSIMSEYSEYQETPTVASPWPPSNEAQDVLEDILNPDPKDMDEIVEFIPEENKEEVENQHRLQWERGEIDYMGKDSFENILSKLNSSIINPRENLHLSTEE